jgi:hypothetical protein
LSKKELAEKPVDYFTKEFDNWYKDLKPDSIYKRPSFKENQYPCQTDFFKNFRVKYEALFLALENFYLLYYQLEDDKDIIKKNKDYFEEFNKTFEAQIEKFKKELEDINTKKEENQLKRINLNRFKEVRKLINRDSNTHAQYNYEMSTNYKKEIEKEFMKKTKDEYDSTGFVKKLKDETDVFNKQVDKTLELMKLQGLQSLFLQLKADKSLAPENTEFLAPYQRYVKYKKVILKIETIEE